MARFNFTKDPSSVLDWTFDWSKWLDEDETIVTSAFAVDDGVDIQSHNHDDTTTLVWLTGGTAGETYRLTNTVTTSNDRSDDRSITIRVTER